MVEQDEQIDVEAEAPADTGMHPIKALEAFFKGHLRQTTTLASHVRDIAGTASEAFKLAEASKGQALDLFERFKQFAQVSEQRFQQIERRLEAIAPPDLSKDLEGAAAKLDTAVADVGAATGAVDPHGDPAETGPA